MKRKIRWIHRRFPRYYQWWWSLKPSLRLGWLLFFPMLGAGAWLSQSFVDVLLIAFAFVLGLVAISLSLSSLNKEDLCKYE